MNIKNDKARTYLLGLAIIIGLIVIVFMTIPRQAKRQFPNREPVIFWHMWTAEWKTVCEQICDMYNQSQTKYEVIPLSIPGTVASSKFILSVAGKNPPDLMNEWDPVIPKFAESNLLYKMEDFMTPQELAYFNKNAYPFAKKCGMYKGSIYGMCIGSNIYALYYRIDDLKRKGFDTSNFPKTLEEFMQVSHKLNEFDKRGNITKICFLPRLLYFYNAMFGEGFYNWKTEKLTINTPDNLRALEFLLNERKNLGFDQVTRFESGLNNAGTGGSGGSNVDWPFLTGEYFMTLDGQWRVVQLKQFAPNLNYGTIPVPAPKNGRKIGGWTNGNYMVIPKGAKNPKGAWDFTKFWSGFTNPESAGKIATMGGWLPLFPYVAKSKVYQKYLKEYPQFKTFVDMLPSKNLQPLPPIPFQQYFQDTVNRYDDLCMRGRITAKEAISLIEKDMKNEIKRRKQLGYK